MSKKTVILCIFGISLLLVSIFPFIPWGHTGETRPQVMIETRLVDVSNRNFLETAFLPGCFLYQEENRCRSEARIPEDPYLKSKGSWGQSYDDQWAIKRVGFTEESDSAWNIEDGGKNPIVVALIDTGLDWNHLDMNWSNIWNNSAEIPDNGKDDDQNGYVDDVIGWNFMGMNSKPWDEDGHGTFVTGVIAAAQNDVGIAGINRGARIMVLKALNDFGHTRASFLAEAIFYAANNGARVINISVGGKYLTRTEQEAVDYARGKGALVVVAAGNEAMSTKDYAPAGLKGVITVASTDTNDNRAGFSNWGGEVDIAAPGLDVLSLRARRTDMLLGIPDIDYTARTGYVGKDNRYYRASGTSFSAPMVAATASLIWARNPNLTNDQVARMLRQSARDISVPGWDQYTGYGILDARAALKADPEFYLITKITGVNVIQQGNQVLIGVLGTVDADRLSEAWIEIGAGKDPKEWKRVSKAITKSVLEGQLDAIPAQHFGGAKQWIIRLIGKHQNGKQREARFNLQLG